MLDNFELLIDILNLIDQFEQIEPIYLMNRFGLIDQIKLVYKFQLIELLIEKGVNRILCENQSI